MAIDTSLFGANIPAGTYAVGDVIQLKNIAGPSVVRSGRGAAILKRISSGIIISASGSASYWKVQVKNSDWIDPATNFTASLDSDTMLDHRSGCVQAGHDAPLTPNSSWEVTAVCISGTTTTVANSLWCTIDIDYPEVSAITDPDKLVGVPSSIEYDTPTIAFQVASIESATWHTENVDIFKAGYQYALEKLEVVGIGAAAVGFLALSNAAGMGGLTRIIPINSNVAAIRNKVEYATKLVKGPMDIRVMAFNNAGTATTGSITAILDFVKRV